MALKNNAKQTRPTSIRKIVIIIINLDNSPTVPGVRCQEYPKQMPG